MKFEDQQLAILQCPQCDGWFVDTADRDGEARPMCFEGYNPPDEAEGRYSLCSLNVQTALGVEVS